MVLRISGVYSVSKLVWRKCSVAHSPGLQFGNQCNVVKNFRRQLSDLAKKTPKSPPNTLRYAALKQTSLAGVAITGYLICRHRLQWDRAFCEYKTSRVIAGRNETCGAEAVFKWSKLWSLLRPEIWYLIGAVISALIAAVINIQIPIALGDIVNIISHYTHEPMGNFMKDVSTPALKLVAMYGLQGAVTFVYISLLSVMGENFAARLRKELFQSIITQDIAFFDEHKTGEIVNRLTADVQDFKSSFKLCISQGLKSITQTIGCAISLYMLSPKLTGLLIVVVPSIIGVGTFIGSLLRTLSKNAQAQVAKATGVADEAIGNVRTVRAFAMEDKEMQLFNEEVDRSAKLSTRLGIGIGLFQGLSNVALNGIILGTLYAGGILMADGDLAPGHLMSFMVAAQTVQRSLAQVSLLFGQAVKGMSSGARVFEYIDMHPAMSMKGGITIPYHAIRGNVKFENVSFTYPTRPNQKVLSDFSLDVPGGRMVALCGLSGGGKSTVASLLERFYDVQEGSIKIDNVDLKQLDPHWLRGRAIGFINQEPVLFATTVLENIRYGRPEATDQEVREAAQLANAHDFINGFPEGYSTILGERGITVSGGQKQRIAIARALLKNPSILILDEATSALDAESERLVQSALDRVIKGRTVLVIAHRLSTIRDADVIAVMSNGVIAEMGSHTDLKRKKGLYWELIRQQESEEVFRHRGS